MSEVHIGDLDMPTSPERDEKFCVTFAGRLKDLGLGNPEGIPTTLETNEQIEAYGQKLLGALAPVTDTRHYRCIDGRNCLHNADGSDPEVRAGQVGGTGQLFEAAVDGDSPLLEGISLDATALEIAEQVDVMYEKQTGVKPSAHTGGCGGVNGALQDAEAIANDPKIAGATEALMGLGLVRRFTKLTYNPEAMSKVSLNASRRADLMRQTDWQGQQYVDSVQAREPGGVEVLDTGEPDAPFHNHREPAVAILMTKGQSLSEAKMRELGMESPFVWNLDASLEEAVVLGRERGESGVTQAFMANCAKHLAVADRLPSDETPVIIIEVV